MFEPKFEGEIEGYVANFLHVNHWRVASTVLWQDCEQEAYVVFLRCKRKYKVDNPAHFMSLFKTAWFNCFTDLSNENTAHREMFDWIEDAVAMPLECAGETENDGYLATLIRQAPRDVTLVLNLFLNAPQEMLDIALSGWVNGDKRSKSKGSKKINRLLGLSPDQDTMGKVAEYFGD